MPREFNLAAFLEATFELPGERNVRVLLEDALQAVASRQDAAEAEVALALQENAQSLDAAAFRISLGRARAAFEQRLLRHVHSVNAEQSAWLCRVAGDLFGTELSLLTRVREQVASGDLDLARAEKIEAHIRRKTDQAVEQALRMTHETADRMKGHLASILTTTA